MNRITIAIGAALLLAAPPATTFAETAPAPAAPTLRTGLVRADSNLLVVFAQPVPGQQQGFNAWYDRHMREIMKLPDFVRVQKFHMLPRKGRPDPAFPYMVIYEFKGDKAMGTLIAAMGDGRVVPPDNSVVGKLDLMNFSALGAGYAGALAPVSPASRVGLVPEDSKLLVVLADPATGQETAFETWYDQHVRDFMNFPNYDRVQKFRASAPAAGQPPQSHRYLFLFEFKGDQDASFAQTQAAIREGRLPLPDSKVVAKVNGMNYGPDGAGYLGTAPE